MTTENDNPPEGAAANRRSSRSDGSASVVKLQKLYDALKEISRYAPPENLRRNSERAYGVGGDEAIEMAYENVIATAKHAIRGMRRPNSEMSSRKETTRHERSE